MSRYRQNHIRSAYVVFLPAAMAIENTFLMDNGSCPRLHEQTVNSRQQEKGETGTERGLGKGKRKETRFSGTSCFHVSLSPQGLPLAGLLTHCVLRPMDYLQRNHSRSSVTASYVFFRAKDKGKDDKEHPLVIPVR